MPHVCCGAMVTAAGRNLGATLCAVAFPVASQPIVKLRLRLRLSLKADIVAK